MRIRIKLRVKCLISLIKQVNNTLTRSSAVAVIADRTAYDIRYSGKLSKQFRLQVDERLVRTTHDPIQWVELMNAPKLYLLKRD